VDGIDAPLVVTSCADGPSPKDEPNTAREFLLMGTGRSGARRFRLKVSRVRTEVLKGRPATTETATISSGSGMRAAGLEASRSEVDGHWTDLRDLSKNAPLIGHDGDLVRIAARFGAAGTTATDKLTFGSLRARCP
jgi:hypothetical protein